MFVMSACVYSPSGGNLCGLKPFPHQGTYREMKAWGAASETQQQARYT